MDLFNQTDINVNNQEHALRSDKEICFLCKRERPIFLVDKDDTIDRIPDTSLSPFMRSLK